MVGLNWIPLRLHARDLVVRHHGRTDIPPLLVVSSFTVDLKPTDLWSSTLDRVLVDGLEINIPPKDADTGKRPFPGRTRDTGDDRGESDGLFIRHLIATNTRLAVVPREAGKNAKVWDIFELDMKNLRSGEPATFTAALINPIPYGKIETSGTFGPWRSEQPGESPLAGEYAFAADLGTIEGLAGQLGATGAMDGTLDQIATRGETHTPDFRLTELDGASLPLNTSYEALVDGTKGDVELKRVDVQLGKSRLQATGIVEGTKGIKGKRIVVNVKSSSSDLGELLRLVSKAGRPAAEGVLVIDTALDLPQGKSPILERLALEGSVRAERVKFSSVNVQDKIDELSRTRAGPAQGHVHRRSGVEDGRQVRAQQGRVQVPGAVVQRPGRRRAPGRHPLAPVESRGLRGRGAAQGDRVANADRRQELAVEADRSVVQEEGRRHTAGHHDRRDAGSAEGGAGRRPDPQGQVARAPPERGCPHK